MRRYPRTLLICHGRLHERHIDWLPFMNSPKAKRIWDDAKYIDTDPSVSPDVVGDVAALPDSTFPADSFDIVIAVNCPVSIYFEDESLRNISKGYWHNVAHWLALGGVYLNAIPMAFLRRRKSPVDRKTVKRKTRSLKRSRHLPPLLQRFMRESELANDDFQISVAMQLLRALIRGSSEFSRLCREASSKNPAYAAYADWLLSDTRAVEFVADTRERLAEALRECLAREDSPEEHRKFAESFQAVLEQINLLVHYTNSRFVQVDMGKRHPIGARIACIRKESSKSS